MKGFAIKASMSDGSYLFNGELHQFHYYCLVFLNIEKI